MRKIKLQMQLSLDGFVAGPNGEIDWLIWNWDETLKNYISEITNSIDTILLGRVLAEGFINVWASRAAAPDADEFTHKMNDDPKIIFSKTLESIKWNNTRLAGGDITEEVARLKQEPGRDLMLYGGARLVSSFIKHNLIDEYYLFVNPVILGAGLPIFSSLESRLGLKLIESRTFSCGIVSLCYQPHEK